ncbi:MAG TPA: branched-chain amino acid ABC transporter permease [Candidatus Binatia bacterium]|nr:branched-chain amino acid ABC transporter permease [Candidatus Binatia bacterium]
MGELVHLTVTGLLIASLLALGAVGLSLTFGIARFANVAHPDFMMLGAYATFTLNHLLGVDFWAAALLGVAAAVTVGVPVARLAYDRLPVSGTVQLLIISIGVSFVLRHVVLFFFGSGLLQYAVPLQRPWVWGPVRLTTYQLVTLAVAGLLVLAVHLLLARTTLGRILRAMADNPTLCEIAGADVSRARLAMWVIAVTLAATGGVLWGLNLVIQPNMGWDLVIPIFSAAILGGIGNPYGAMAGALVIGIGQEWSTLLIPSMYKEAVAFTAMGLCLMFRPRGLWGG